MREYLSHTPPLGNYLLRFQEEKVPLTLACVQFINHLTATKAIVAVIIPIPTCTSNGKKLEIVLLNSVITDPSCVSNPVNIDNTDYNIKCIDILLQNVPVQSSQYLGIII